MGISNSNFKIDMSTLQKGFKEYLEGKQTTDASGVKTPSSANASIFLHGEEFKNYLVQEIGLDETIFSQSIDELVTGITTGSVFEDNEEALENVTNLIAEQQAQEAQDADGEAPVDGEAADVADVEADAAADGDVALNDDETFMLQALTDALSDEDLIGEYDIDGDGEITQADIDDFLKNAKLDGKEFGELTFDEISDAVSEGYQNAIQNMQDTQVLNRLLDKVFEDDKVIAALDIDGDGKLSEEEKEKFKEYIKGYSDDGDELTEADIKRAYNDILDGKFSYDDDLKDKAEELDKKAQDEVQEAQSASPASSAGGASGAGGGGGGVASGSNSFSNSAANAAPKTIDNMSLEELEAEKTTRQQAVDDAQKEVDSINSGEKFKSEEENVEKLKEAYEEALKKDENTPPELIECMENIDAKEAEINETETSIAQLTTQEFEQQNTLSAAETTLSALKSTQSELNSASSDDPEKQAEISRKKTEIQSKIDEVQKQVDSAKTALQKTQDDKKAKEELLTTQKGELEELNKTKTKIEEENKDKLSEETQKAMEAYNEAKTELETQKASALEEAKTKLTSAQEDLKAVNDKINEKKAAATAKEYSVNQYDFDFNLKLSDSQARDLQTFKDLFENNKDKYQKVEEATGVPAELIAAIHWRESGGNFNTYLHNGDPLGQTTTHVPKGVYFEDWTSAAIDAMQNYGGNISSIDKNDINTWYDYAERYNGLGYRNRGVMSPYVWAGTDKYTGGKYVADGVYDPNHYDQQLGVATMLQSLLS